MSGMSPRHYYQMMVDMAMSTAQLPWALAIGAASALVLVMLLVRTPWSLAQVGPSQDTTVAVGELLLSRYMIGFEGAAFLILAGMVGAVIFAKRERILAPQRVAATPSAGAEIYTCPMHPEIWQQGPGQCPICGMNLAPAEQPVTHSPAGALDHAVGGTALARMGGLARHLPHTFIAFTIGAAALAGLPVTLALPPKDPALAAAWHANPALFAMTLLVSLLTALYSARALGLLFLGAPSGSAPRAPAARPGLVAPMLISSALVVVGLLVDALLLGRPLGRLLGAEAPEAGLVTTSALVVAVVGVGLGLWARTAWSDTIVWPPLARVGGLFASEAGLKTLYHSLARLGLRAMEAASDVDRRTFDPLGSRVAGIAMHAVQRARSFDEAIFGAAAARTAASMLTAVEAGRRLDLRGIEAAIERFGHALLAVSQRLRALQTGRIENYLLAVFVWGLGLIALAALIMAVP
jgi:hypothetical protein